MGETGEVSRFIKLTNAIVGETPVMLDKESIRWVSRDSSNLYTVVLQQYSDLIAAVTESVEEVMKLIEEDVS